VSLRFGVHFSGCGGGASLLYLCTCRPLFKEPPKMVLRRILSPSLETGAVFRCCTVGELLQDCDLVSVIAVQEKCDEKGLGAASGHRSVRCRQFGRGPSSAIPLDFARGFGKTGPAFSKSARRGAPPSYFVSTLKDTHVTVPL